MTDQLLTTSSTKNVPCLGVLFATVFMTHFIAINSPLPQEIESEYNLATMVEMSSSVPKADPSQFELLKVLGQGSFGKVGPHPLCFEKLQCGSPFLPFSLPPPILPCFLCQGLINGLLPSPTTVTQEKS